LVGGTLDGRALEPFVIAGLAIIVFLAAFLSSGFFIPAYRWAIESLLVGTFLLWIEVIGDRTLSDYKSAIARRGNGAGVVASMEICCINGSKSAVTNTDGGPLVWKRSKAASAGLTP
jgi:hypothetical protein